MTLENFNDDVWSTSCLVLSQKNYHHSGLVQRLVKNAATPSGNAISSAHPNGQMANFLMGRYESRYFQFIPEALTLNGGQSWASTYHSPGFGEIPVSLANRNTDVCADRHPFAGSVGLSRRRNRRLDTYYADSNKRLDFLHIAEPTPRIINILCGGEELIKHNQPILVFEYTLADELISLATYLEQIGYFLFDSTLRVVDVMSSHCVSFGALQTESLFVGLPKTFVEGGRLIKALWPNDKRLAMHHCWQDAIIAGLAREARHGGIRFDARPSMSQHYPFNDKLICEGFYPAEYENEHSWRWLGPKPSASIRLARPSAGCYQLMFGVIGIAEGVDIAELRLFFAGKQIEAKIQTSDEFTKVMALIEFPIDENVTNSDFELVLAVPATLQVNPDDERRLGICISHVDLVFLESKECL